MGLFYIYFYDKNVISTYGVIIREVINYFLRFRWKILIKVYSKLLMHVFRKKSSQCSYDV